MDDGWAVLIAGVIGFCGAYILQKSREQEIKTSDEFQKWRKEIRKLALLVTSHTPQEYGGCSTGRSQRTAVAKLRQLHTGFAVRVVPGDKAGVDVLEKLELLISDIDNGSVGKQRHAEVVGSISALLAGKQSGGEVSGKSEASFKSILKWLYNLPDYLTEYDRERKTN